MDEQWQQQLIVRDGVLYVPQWEWNTSEGQILGFPCQAFVSFVNLSPPYFLVSLTFANGWMIFFTIPRADDLRIEVWSCRLHDPSERDTPHMSINSLDRLLGCIRTIAERSARKEEHNG